MSDVNNKANDVKIGYVSLIDLSDDEFELLLDYFEYKKAMPSIRYLASMLGKDNLLELLDLFAGELLKIPNRNETIKLLSNISLYNYLKQRDFSDDSIVRARGLYKRKTDQILSIIEQFDNLNVADDESEADTDE